MPDFFFKKKMRVYKIPFIETSRNCKTKVMTCGCLWMEALRGAEGNKIKLGGDRQAHCLHYGLIILSNSLRHSLLTNQVCKNTRVHDTDLSQVAQ